MTFEANTLRWSESFEGAYRPRIGRHLLNEDNTAHDHDFMELAVVLGGAARHLCDQGEVAIEKGSAVLLRPGTWHAYLDCRDLDVLNFCFPLTMARDEWRHLLHEGVRSMLRSREGLRMTRLPSETIDALKVLEPVSRNASGDLGFVIWALDQFAAAVPEKRSLHPGVERAVRLFEDGLGQPWTATSLSQAVGLDKAYLSRLFKAQVGVGPMAYLALLRAERAASLLRGSELNCGEIGHTVGYSDGNLFSRRFRARFGVSPSAYRKRARGEARTPG